MPLFESDTALTLEFDESTWQEVQEPKREANDKSYHHQQKHHQRQLAPGGSWTFELHTFGALTAAGAEKLRSTRFTPPTKSDIAASGCAT
eukprot:4525753-Amphidinium_carterae.1